MKKTIALLLAVLMLFCALPLGVQAADADVACRMTLVSLDSLQLQVLEVLEAALRARQEKVELSEYHIRLSALIDVVNELSFDPEYFFYDYALPYFDVETEEVLYLELYYREEYGEYWLKGGRGSDLRADVFSRRAHLATSCRPTCRRPWCSMTG